MFPVVSVIIAVDLFVTIVADLCFAEILLWISVLVVEFSCAVGTFPSCFDKRGNSNIFIPSGGVPSAPTDKGSSKT